LAALIVLGGCDEAERPPEAMAAACTILQSAQPIEPGLEESSGVVASRVHAGVLWTHNDSGWPADIFAIDVHGEIRATIPVVGAENVDWEDIALAACGTGECLYIADIGDNRAVREQIAVYRLPEPSPNAREAPGAERFPMRYPDGARDAEGFFVLPTGEMFVVTKGNEKRAALYRYPPPLRAGVEVVLEHVVDLSAGPLELLDQLTAADAPVSGNWIAIRSYQELRIYRSDALLAGDTVPVLRYDLTDVEAVQGEGLALLDDGTVYLTGEGGFDDEPGSVARLRCTLP
jgi:hypothetical protein